MHQPRDLYDIPDRSHQDLSIESKNHRRVHFRCVSHSSTTFPQDTVKLQAQYPKIHPHFGVFWIWCNGETSPTSLLKEARNLSTVSSLYRVQYRVQYLLTCKIWCNFSISVTEQNLRFATLFFYFSVFALPRVRPREMLHHSSIISFARVCLPSQLVVRQLESFSNPSLICSGFALVYPFPHHQVHWSIV